MVYFYRMTPEKRSNLDQYRPSPPLTSPVQMKCNILSIACEHRLCKYVPPPLCLSFPLYVILHCLPFPLACLSIPIVCYYHLSNIFHCMPIPIVYHSPLYVIPHYMVLTTVCHITLSFTHHCLTFLLYIILFPLSAIPTGLLFLIVFYYHFSCIPNCLPINHCMYYPLSAIPHCI